MIEGGREPSSPVVEDPSTAPWPSFGRALAVTLAVTVVVTVIARAVPGELANLGVAGAFLGATWWLVLGHDTPVIRAYGLSLGGLLEPERIEPRRMVRTLVVALGLTALLALVCFPPFALGYAKLWASGRPFVWRVPPDWPDRVAGQVLVIALPEEAFFRGYLQSALDGRLGARFRIFGAEVGLGWLLSAALFAVGHVLTVPDPARLAVFFPALAFGWLRARTGGIGASLAFHAACNLFSSWLALAYGLRAR
ncbi:MAG: CPBP family intramembrane metalloprotease [Deltaproteobacteria bacterium]|nr:CPBP family intramembrane metalloprotease [Deltaproteobacteria bacterium]